MIISEQDEQAVKNLFFKLRAAWNKGDGEAYANCFTEHADYVTFSGVHLKGREEIDSAHQKLFNTLLKGSQMEGEGITDMRGVTPDLIIFHAVYALRMRWQIKAPENRRSINTNVVFRKNGEWKIVSFHNCRIQPPSFFQRLYLTFFAK